MSEAGVKHITSRDNPVVATVRSLARDSTAYRRIGQVWLEGDHLCSAFLHRGGRPVRVVCSDTALRGGRFQALLAAGPVAVLPDALFAACSGVEAPTGIGFLIEVPPVRPLDTKVDTVVLDRLQDAGNVGAILRSAAAFGVRQVIALKGTAALWSPKVVRAGMGSHFALHLHEGLDVNDLPPDLPPMLGTSSHAERALHELDLPTPCTWVLGHEGQGVGPELQARCSRLLRIPQPGGEESLNVGAAAAVCLYESARQRSTGRGAPQSQ